MITFRAVADDGIERRVDGFKVVAYDIPAGCCAAYYPETNALLPLSHRDTRSNTPAAKSVPVQITAMRQRKPASSYPEVAEKRPEAFTAMPPVA